MGLNGHSAGRDSGPVKFSEKNCYCEIEILHITPKARFLDPSSLLRAKKTVRWNGREGG